MRPTLRHRCLLALALPALLLAREPAPLRAEGAAPLAADSTRLLERAKVLYPQRPSDESALAPHREALLSLADSLEAAGLVGAAGRGYEWAGIDAFRFGHLDDALNTWRAGLAMVRGHGHAKMEASLLNAIAVGHAAGGHREEAAASWLELLPLREALGDTFGLGVTWGNIANVYNELGRVGEALEATREAERWDRLADNRKGMGASLLRRAELMAAQGRRTEALAWADTCLAYARAEDEGASLGLALVRRAEVLDELGRSEEALAQLDEGIATLESRGERYYAVFCRNLRLQLLLNLGRAAECLEAARALRPELEALGHAPLLTDARGLEGRALLAPGRGAEAESLLSTALAAFEVDREAQEDPATRAGLQRRGAQICTALARCGLRRGHPEDAWAALERGRAPLLRERLGGDAPVALDSLRATLKAMDAVLIQYDSFASDTLLVMAVLPAGLEVVDLPLGNVLDLEADARAALGLMAAGSPDSLCLPPLSRLSRRLLEPVLARLPAGVERLAIVAPDALAGFPFEALPTADGPLGERFGVSYLPSASALPLLVERRAAPAGMLALADPPALRAERDALRDPSRGLGGQALPEARREIRDIAVDGCRLLEGAAASADSLRSAGPGRAVLHFATHALINPLNGEDAALLLARGASSALLPAREVESLPLSADLVTLSACRSSLGLVLPGEGSFGLPRSFLVAGSRSVVSSLWDVEDGAARRFMARFYAALRDGDSRDLALRRARRELADAGYPLRDRAAFVLSGVGAAPVPALAHHPLASAGGRGRWLVLLPLVALLGWWLAARADRRRNPGGRSGALGK
ncbi:MAG: CHAT domain-containing protein [Candidatus Latescibacteria bacterium]|nr:CHAT domain-containing protein [Candidatus Latescibacterota bacterium]